MRTPASPVTTARWLIGAAAFLSFALSVILYFTGDEEAGIFVGLWVPSILALGAFVLPRRAVKGEGRPAGGRR
jgi:hypothetical protein